MFLKKAIFSVLAAIILSVNAYAAELPSLAQAEIAHLLVYLSTSGCEFYRNGSWYNAEAARSHLERKYKYLLKKQLISSAEDFIAKAATQSSMSSETYQVRCGKDIFPCAAWLNAELARLRQKQALP